MRPSCSWACALSLAFANMASHAASLQVSPVSIQLSGTENGKVVNLRNEGDQPIHAQVRIFAWDQADDEDKLTPTRDLIASPPIAEVPAGGQQVIRIMRATSQPVPQERAYRLLIDELPPDNANNGTAVQFRFRYSMPLFIAPSGDSVDPKLDWAIVQKNGQPFLRVNNSGTVHARLSAVSIRTPTNETIVTTGLLGYVLPGRVRAWSLANIANSLRGKATGVTATVNSASVKATLTNGNEP